MKVVPVEHEHVNLFFNPRMIIFYIIAIIIIGIAIAITIESRDEFAIPISIVIVIILSFPFIQFNMYDSHKNKNEVVNIDGRGKVIKIDKDDRVLSPLGLEQRNNPVAVIRDKKTRHRIEIGRNADIEKGDEIEIHSKSPLMKGKDTNAYGILNDDDYKITKIAK